MYFHVGTFWISLKISKRKENAGSYMAPTAYVLIWPLIALGVLTVITVAFFTEWVRSRREGRDII